MENSQAKPRITNSERELLINTILASSHYLEIADRITLGMSLLTMGLIQLVQPQPDRALSIEQIERADHYLNMLMQTTRQALAIHPHIGEEIELNLEDL